MSREDAAPEAPTFEEGIKRIAEIVELLEKGDLPLEESLRVFEEGVTLTRAVQAKLDAAEKKVETLLDVRKDGSPITEPFAG